MSETGRITAKSGLHLRERAVVTSPILTVVPYGTVITIDGREGNWLKVTYNFRSGYLYKEYVDILGVVPPDIDPPYDPPKQLQSYSKTIVVLVIAIVAAILAFSYGSLGWNP